jgi:hypothetical protein
MQSNWRNEAAALWLAPVAATIPLIPFVSIPSSPFFLGKLMDDPMHPFNWPHIGPLISAMAAFLDAESLGIVIVLFLVAPIYAMLRKCGRNTAGYILTACAVSGVVASLIARVIAQSFRQADLRAFANSEASLGLGCLCGLAAGGFVAYFAGRRIARPLICCAPISALAVSAVLQVCLVEVGRSH